MTTPESPAPERAASTVAAPLLEALLRTSTAHRSGTPEDKLSTLESATDWLDRALPRTEQTGPAIGGLILAAGWVAEPEPYQSAPYELELGTSV